MSKVAYFIYFLKDLEGRRQNACHTVGARQLRAKGLLLGRNGDCGRIWDIKNDFWGLSHTRLLHLQAMDKAETGGPKEGIERASVSLAETPAHAHENQGWR